MWLNKASFFLDGSIPRACSPFEENATRTRAAVACKIIEDQRSDDLRISDEVDEV